MTKTILKNEERSNNNLLFNSQRINVTVGNGPVEESIRVFRSNKRQFQKQQNGTETE